MQLRKTFRHSMHALVAKSSRSGDDDSTTLGDSFASLSSSCSSLEVPSEDFTASSPSHKSSIRQGNSLPLHEADKKEKKSVSFGDCRSYFDNRDLTAEEVAALWFSAAELEELREEMTVIARSLVFLRKELNSYYTLVKQAHETCHTMDGSDLALFSRRYRFHHRSIGMERSIRSVRHGMSDRHKKLRQVIHAHNRSSRVARFLPGRAERLRARCEAISQPSRAFAECLALAQQQESFFNVERRAVVTIKRRNSMF